MRTNSQRIKKLSCGWLMVGKLKRSLVTRKEKLCNEHKEHLPRRLGDAQMKITYMYIVCELNHDKHLQYRSSVR